MFTIAHLSDIHLPLAPSLPRPLSVLANKRLLGFLSWHAARKAIHRPEILGALLADLRSIAPDQIVVTGDLVNIALPDEFQRALSWLRGVGTPERVMVVPGNHDAQVATRWHDALGRWAGYLSGDGHTGGHASFPAVRERADVALIGLSSAVPTAWFKASGRLGSSQIAALEKHLRALGRKGLFRIVLLHHPPCSTMVTARKGLLDHAEFRDAVSRAGAELVLHGHTHSFCMSRIETRTGYAPAFGSPSASALLRDGEGAG